MIVKHGRFLDPFLCTCSVDCVKRHKIDHGCSGVRCKTKFVPLTDFSDNHFYSGEW